MNLSRSLLFLAALIIIITGCVSDVTDTDNDFPDDPPFDFNHKQSPGASNQAFITDTQFDELVVEVQFMPGAEPLEESLQNLRVFLERHLQKTTITILEPTQIPSLDQAAYSVQDIVDIENEHRENFTSENRLASYALFVDGEFTSQNVLGIAYFNTSTAYFGETIDRVTSDPFAPSRTTIESTVLNHEYGHLMGLVNNGTEMVHDHHDADNGAHCTNEQCLMYFTVNTSNFFENLLGDNIRTLDEFCTADIEAVKE